MLQDTARQMIHVSTTLDNQRFEHAIVRLLPRHFVIEVEIKDWKKTSVFVPLLQMIDHCGSSGLCQPWLKQGDSYSRENTFSGPR